MKHTVRRLVIVAHYDPDGLVDPAFVAVLEQVRALATDLIVVSTNLRESQVLLLDQLATVIVRPNVGYDFASWRAGIGNARRTLSLEQIDEIVLLNNSFYVLRDGAIADLFERMRSSEVDLWGASASHQYAYHLQSFFLVFRRPAFRSTWFADFWTSVWEYGDRDFVITHYELPLARSAREHGLRVGAAFDTHLVSGIAAADLDANPMHIHWEAVATMLGIAKAELVRANPHAMALASLPAIAAPVFLAAIEAHSARTRPATISVPAALPLAGALDEMRLYGKSSTAEVAVHIHLHYLDLASDLFDFVRSIVVPCDVYVTITNMDGAPDVVRLIKSYRPEARIALIENRGRDIAPFLTLLRSRVFDHYKAVCKIHSKKSTYSSAGARWRNMLLSEILGSSALVLDILDAFERRPELGMVVPHTCFVRKEQHWGANLARATALAAKLFPERGSAVLPLAFPAGSMYWLRPRAFAGFARPELALEDFEQEGGIQDGTLAHVIERLTAIATWSAGFVVAGSKDLGGRLGPEGLDTSVIPVLP